MRHAPFLLLLALLAALPAQAQWKWRDANGVTQYSDLPPPQGTPEKDILQRPANAKRGPVTLLPVGAAASAAAAAASAAAPKPAASRPDAAEQKRQEEERQARLKDEQEKQRMAEQRRENCSRAQENLRSLQSGTRITKVNEQGQRVFLDETQLAGETARARQLVASECR
ncbi:DUF4124 domain-containing protein [Roseateles paludis]|jgi:hypothetical protein|uniref:DUF4124 domain-containing protein n=1 Tax=Roseateles paludis TaxID=3145238 RepID=A0ABV0G086_9BURK